MYYVFIKDGIPTVDRCNDDSNPELCDLTKPNVFRTLDEAQALETALVESMVTSAPTDEAGAPERG